MPLYLYWCHAHDTTTKRLSMPDVKNYCSSPCQTLKSGALKMISLIYLELTSLSSYPVLLGRFFRIFLPLLSRLLPLRLVGGGHERATNIKLGRQTKSRLALSRRLLQVFLMSSKGRSYTWTDSSAVRDKRALCAIYNTTLTPICSSPILLVTCTQLSESKSVSIVYELLKVT